VVTLGGRFVRPRPVIMVSVTGPAKTHPAEAVIDTGADDTVFPERLAVKIGLDLSNAPVGSGTTASLAHIRLRYARVTLRISDGREHREWPAWVGFTSVRLAFPMLGFAGVLQFFDADFRGGREEVELAVNPLYPGT